MTRRWLVPEVIQSSAMDCGPASLKAMLEGYGVPVSYGRLREACQTDVDGTSIDTIEALGRRLGLDATQVIVPVDQVLLPGHEVLPAVVVTRQPNGSTHFVVAWRRHGPLVQVMDPAVGRTWTSTATFLSRLYVHEMPVPVDAWRAYAATDEHGAALVARAAAAGVPARVVTALRRRALEDPGWRPLAQVDAAVRMLDAVTRSAGRLGAASELLEGLATGPADAIPDAWWSARPHDDATVRMRGAVLVKADGLLKLGEATEPLPPDLAAALSERPGNPLRRVAALLAEGGALRPAAVAAGLGLAGATVLVEALLLRGLMEIGPDLGDGVQRGLAVVAVLVFLVAAALADLGVTRAVLAGGREMEARLRVAWLSKIPRLGDRYLRSRLTSDMAERAHSVHALRDLPEIGSRIVRTGFEMAFTVAGLAWLDPRLAPLAAAAALASVALPVAAHKTLTERDLRARSHSGALARFYLDALMGLTAIRSHSAARAVRHEHEALLVEWARAGFRLNGASVWIEGAQTLVGLILAASMLAAHALASGDAGAALLLVYWSLAVPVLGERLAVALRRLPAQRNLAARLVEPLDAPEEAVDGGGGRTGEGAVALRFEGVSVVASGHVILDGVDLDVPAGSHVAVVGPSGAGKSSLVGLLLGWHRAASGAVLVDGAPIDVGGLRRRTAWVDPEVHLWNRSFADNLRYGGAADADLGPALRDADLLDVLQRLPDGLQTPLGDGGGRLSGGEGQRVRLGRGLLRERPGLVILDEPFRGLDRGKRRDLLRRARERWAGVTLICITHDVGETAEFPRVVVVDGGKVAEDGAPAALLAAESRYRDLVAAEDAVRTGLWQGATWRRLRMAGGRLVEGAP